MTYTLLLLPLIFAYTNREYGAGEKAILPDWASMSVQGMLLALACYLIAETPIAWAAIGILPLIGACWLVRVSGKGKWFPHAGDTSAERERLSPVVDTITAKILGAEYDSLATPGWAIKYKALATGVAWAVCSVLKYAILAVMLGNPIALVGIPAMLAVGWVYKYCFQWFPNVIENDKLVKDREVPYSEWATGVFIGIIDAGLIWVI